MLPLLALLALTPGASAQDPWPGYETQSTEGSPEGLGLGLIIGIPTGFTGAYHMGRNTVDGAVAWSIPDERLYIHGDYLFTLYTFRDPAVPEVVFPLYLGLGGQAQIGFNSTYYSTLGIRVPVGIAAVPTTLELPLEVFLEIAPVVGLYPETALWMNAALGVRLYPF